MSTKEMAINLLNSMNEDQLLDFFRIFVDDNTLALAESEYIGKHPERKHYANFREILNEVMGEMDDE